jgi:2-keto-4-pentenoate hydratase
VTASERVRQAAEYLARLRRPGPRPRSLPPELSPRSAPEAYAVQRELLRTLDMRPGGWKIAMGSPEQGTSAPVLLEDIHSSPARQRCLLGDTLGIEPEVAFALRYDLPVPAVGGGYRREELIDAIDAAYAAIEVIVSRFRSHDGAEPLDRLADNISNGGLVLSAPCRDWQRLDLRTIALRLTREAADGTRIEHASDGGHSLGDPLDALLWLANDRSRGDAGLRAGEFITTGSYAGLCHAAPGTRVTAQFAGLGTATLLVD